MKASLRIDDSNFKFPGENKLGCGEIHVLIEVPVCKMAKLNNNDDGTSTRYLNVPENTRLSLSKINIEVNGINIDTPRLGRPELLTAIINMVQENRFVLLTSPAGSGSQGGPGISRIGL